VPRYVDGYLAEKQNLDIEEFEESLFVKRDEMKE
jgi:hypothetical protein